MESRRGRETESAPTAESPGRLERGVPIEPLSDYLVGLGAGAGALGGLPVGAAGGLAVGAGGGPVGNDAGPGGVPGRISLGRREDFRGVIGDRDPGLLCPGRRDDLSLVLISDSS